MKKSHYVPETIQWRILETLEDARCSLLHNQHSCLVRMKRAQIQPSLLDRRVTDEHPRSAFFPE
jgi:hypothetical protein